MPSKVPLMTRAELAELHVGTLMRRRKALLECEASFELSDRFGEKEPNVAKTGVIEFKNTPEWVQAYRDLKEILATKQNVLNKVQRRMVRQQRAKKKRLK